MFLDITIIERDPFPLLYFVRNSASVTAKGTSIRLVLRLSLAAMARYSRMSKGIWLLFLRLSGRTCARCSMSLCLFIVRMMSSIRLQQFVCVKFPDGSKKAQVKFEIGFFFCFIMLYYKYKR